MQIDLNADLGEGCDNDFAMLEYVSSANIACGWHAGDAQVMQATVRQALKHGVSIGAHPSFPDREHFGRREMQLPAEQVRAGLLYQLGALEAIVRAEGATLAHVKPHGALYNQAAKEPALAQTIARTIYEFNPQLKVMGLAGSLFIDILRRQGLQAIEEVFADRAYTASGQLVNRQQPGALIEEEEHMLQQVLGMVQQQQVTAISGELIPIHAQTLCLHGDGAHAVPFARLIRQFLAQQHIAVRAI